MTNKYRIGVHVDRDKYQRHCGRLKMAGMSFTQWLDEALTLTESVLEEGEAPKDEPKREYGNPEINAMLAKIKMALGLDDFKEPQRQQRMYGKHLVNLEAKIGDIEFANRFTILVADSFHRKNMGSLAYIYRQVKGFVPEGGNLGVIN